MKTVTLVEMGLRDGLQNEKVFLSSELRAELACKLSEAGLRRIEVGAFVSSQWVPQMAGTSEVLKQLQQNKRIHKKSEMSVLVPNEKGMLEAIESGAREVAIFTAATDSFTKKNINCTIEESFLRFEPVMKLAKKHKIKVRGYLSTCFGCPFEGKVSEAKVLKLAQRLHQMGCYEISIGDTIGVAHVGQVQSLFKKLKKVVPVKKIAGHFHDTRGQALANIFAAYQVGVRVFDSSLGGLGGCPYAPGATGNVATEDVVYLFQGLGVSTKVDLGKLIEINHWIAPQFDHPLPSRVGKVGVLQPLGSIV